jgi:hypothetical protein
MKKYSIKDHLCQSCSKKRSYCGTTPEDVKIFFMSVVSQEQPIVIKCKKYIKDEEY